MVVGYRTFAGEFCIVNGEFSYLQCLINTLIYLQTDTLKFGFFEPPGEKNLGSVHHQEV